MALDYRTMHSLLDEFKNSLVPARVERVQQVGRQQLLLSLRTLQDRVKLYLSAQAQEATLYLTDERWQSPLRPPAFLQQARKRLQGAELLSVHGVPWERIAVFTFERRNELGDLETVELIGEFMGRHANLMLVKDGVILDAIKHVDHSQSRVREVMPARPYVLPPAIDKPLPDQILAELEAGKDLDQIFTFERRTVPLDRFLLSEIGAVSPLLIKDLLVVANLDDRLDYKELTAGQKEQLKQALTDFLTRFLNPPEGCYVYFEDEGLRRPFDFHVLELKSLPFRKHYTTVSEALASFYQLRHEKEAVLNREQEVRSKIQKALKDRQRKHDLHEKDFLETENLEDDRRYGELLQANFHLLKKQGAGHDSIKVTDYWSPDQVEVNVPLDPKLGPQENLAAYFKAYKKKQAKREIAEGLLRRDRQALMRLSNLDNQIARAEDREDLAAILEELAQLTADKRKKHAPKEEEVIQQPGLPGKRKKRKGPPPKKQKKVREPKRLKPRRYEIDGIRIDVGRNNLQNEELSMHKAQKEWQWFHVKNQPGSHVIAHATKDELTPRATEAAAELAAWYSSANQGHGIAEAEVDTATVKGLRKAKGQGPGQVLYDSEGSFFVTTKGPKAISGLSDLNVDVSD